MRLTGALSVEFLLTNWKRERCFEIYRIKYQEMDFPRGRHRIVIILIDYWFPWVIMDMPFIRFAKTEPQS